MPSNSESSTQPALLSGGKNSENDFSTWHPEFVGRRILLAEDTDVHAHQVKSVLLSAGCSAVDVFANGTDALEALKLTDYDLLLLDISMPGMDGPELLRRIRSGNGPNSNTPAMFLTSATDSRLRRDLMSSHSGLQTKAFFVKPVKDEELIARIGEFLGQLELTTTQTRYVNGPLVVETSPPSVSIAGEQLKVTQRRFDVLLLLIKHCGRPVTRQMIAMAGWTETWAKNGYVIDKPRDDSISALIFQLRKLLKNGAPESHKAKFEDILVAVANEGLRMTKLDDDD